MRQQQAIVDVLDVAPLALSNLNLAYNARSGTLDTRDDVMGPYDPASYVCSLHGRPGAGRADPAGVHRAGQDAQRRRTCR